MGQAVTDGKGNDHPDATHPAGTADATWTEPPATSPADSPE